MAQKHQQLIHQFHRHLQHLGYNKNSQWMLPSVVSEFLEVQQITDFTEVPPSQITEHYEYLQSRPNKRTGESLSEQYIRHHLYGLKVFFQWLIDRGIIHTHPMSVLSFPKPSVKKREILTEAEIQGLYQYCETYKEKALLSLFYGCGLRKSEGIKLNLKDVAFKTGLLYVRQGKGAKRRVIPMAREVEQNLKNYLRKERKAKAGEPAFMCNMVGSRMRGNSYYKPLKKLLKKAEIDKDISCTACAIPLPPIY